MNKSLTLYNLKAMYLEEQNSEFEVSQKPINFELMTRKLHNCRNPLIFNQPCNCLLFMLARVIQDKDFYKGCSKLSAEQKQEWPKKIDDFSIFTELV